jgi:hypothetical protein
MTAISFQKEFAPLVRVEDFDRRREPCRSIVNVTEHQVMPIVVQEPSRLLGNHLVVERLLEPSDLSLVCLARPLNPNFKVRCDPGRVANRSYELRMLCGG